MTASRPSDHAVPGRDVEVLIPTGGARGTLGVTLTALLGQRVLPAAVLVSDQSDGATAIADPVVQGVSRVLRRRGVDVRLIAHPSNAGVAENRHHLLGLAAAPYVLLLDDDILLEAMALGRLCDAMGELRCGAVGMAMTGLSHVDDVRPGDHVPFEPVHGPVEPERVRKGSPAWERWRLHNAATMVHLGEAAGLHGGEPAGSWTAYRVAWTSGCVLVDRAVLVETGGFEFWPLLARRGFGEDVVAQLRVMERAGAVGLLPSEAHSLELPTSIPEREVDAYAAVLAAPAAPAAPAESAAPAAPAGPDSAPGPARLPS